MHYLQCDSYDDRSYDNGDNYPIGDHHLHDNACANNDSCTHNNRGEPMHYLQCDSYDNGHNYAFGNHNSHTHNNRAWAMHHGGHGGIV